MDYRDEVARLTDALAAIAGRQALHLDPAVEALKVVADLRTEVSRLRAELLAITNAVNKVDLDSIHREPMSTVDKIGTLHGALLVDRNAIALLKAKIADAAMNCPSCGRHDFGLVSGDIRALREAEAEVARLREELSHVRMYRRGGGE